MNERFEKKRRWFFALSRELGFDVKETRNRGAKKFGLSSFAEVQEYQLDHLIDLLLVVKRKREYDQV